jgi:hypothetical protein
MKHLKKFEDLNTEVSESFWSDLFGKPSVDSAAHDALRGQGFSHRGKEEYEKDYIIFNGQKFYPADIEYDDAYSTKEIPRIENGKLIVANPAWSM